MRAKVEASAAILSSFATAFRVSAGVPVLRCSATSPRSRWISLMLSFMWASLPNRAMVVSCPPSTIRHLPSCSRHKAVLDCNIGALPGPPKRIEKLPPKVLSGSSLEVNDEHYNATQIRTLYASERYPLTRKEPSM